MTNELVDEAVLTAWMDAAGLGSGPIGNVEFLTGGTQNILMRFARDDRAYILRRPPINKRANSDETMRRESQVLTALEGSNVPHPRLIAFEGDSTLLGASFYLMEDVTGYNLTLGLPPGKVRDFTWQRDVGFAMIDAIAGLAAIDPDEVSNSVLGKGKSQLENQVAKWRRLAESYSSLDSYEGAVLPYLSEVAQWLEAHVPLNARSGLIHGDFHFGNVLVDADLPQINAIVDWELTTIGDPMLDLGHLLATWPGATPSAREIDAPGLPREDELIDRYAQQTGRDLQHLSWFRVLACYRFGIILEGSHARAIAGLTSSEVGDRLHAYAIDLFNLAHHLIGETT